MDLVSKFFSFHGMSKITHTLSIKSRPGHGVPGVVGSNALIMRQATTSYSVIQRNDINKIWTTAPTVLELLDGNHEGDQCLSAPHATSYVH